MAGARSIHARWVVIAIMAVTGAAFFYEFLNDDLHNAGTDVGSTGVPLALRYLIAMAVGGGLSGAICAGMFGRSGAVGWLWAALGAVLATALAGLLGSFFGLIPDLLADGLTTQHLISAGFGLVLIPLSMVGRPVMIAVWLGLVVAAHLLARRARVTKG